MKLNKLLAAVSMVALTATTANAIVLDVDAPAMTVTPALELAFPQPAGNSAPLEFSLDTETGNFPAGNNITVVVSLPSGTSFAAEADGGNVTATGLNGGQASAVLQDGGAVGDDEAEFLVSIPQGSQIDEIDFAFEIRLDECVDSPASLTVTANIDGSGTPIENGVATAEDAAVAPCASALDGVVNDNGDTTFILLPDFTSLSDNNEPVVGTVNYEFSGAARSIDGTPADSTDLSSIEFDVVFEDSNADDYVDEVLLELDGGNTVVGESNGDGTYTFDVNTATNLVDLTDGVADDIIVVIDNEDDTPIPTQQLTVENATVRFNDNNANFISREGGAEGDLDLLRREGQTFGSFDWNGSAGTNSIYRITGLPVGTAVDYTVTVERANPPSANGTYAGTLTSTTGEAVVSSFGDFGVGGFPAFTRADVVMNFEIDEDDAPIDVDRLLARGGIVTNFGDGSNLDSDGDLEPTVDADNDDNVRAR